MCNGGQMSSESLLYEGIIKSNLQIRSNVYFNISFSLPIILVHIEVYAICILKRDVHIQV